MRTRLHHDPDAQPNMGDDRRTTVWVEFTPDEGMAVDGYDSTSWPSPDYEWHIRVAGEEFEQLRNALGAEPGDDTFDAFVRRFEGRSYSEWLGFSGWLKEHGVEFTFSSRTSDN